MCIHSSRLYFPSSYYPYARGSASHHYHQRTQRRCSHIDLATSRRWSSPLSSHLLVPISLKALTHASAVLLHVHLTLFHPSASPHPACLLDRVVVSTHRCSRTSSSSSLLPLEMEVSAQAIIGSE